MKKVRKKALQRLLKRFQLRAIIIPIRDMGGLNAKY